MHMAPNGSISNNLPALVVHQRISSSLEGFCNRVSVIVAPFTEIAQTFVPHLLDRHHIGTVIAHCIFSFFHRHEAISWRKLWSLERLLLHFPRASDFGIWPRFQPAMDNVLAYGLLIMYFWPSPRGLQDCLGRSAVVEATISAAYAESMSHLSKDHLHKWSSDCHSIFWYDR